MKSVASKDTEHEIKKLQYKLSRDADAVFGAEHRKQREGLEKLSSDVSGAVVQWSVDTSYRTLAYENYCIHEFLKLAREYVRLEYMRRHGKRYPEHMHKQHCAEIYYLLKGEGALTRAYAEILRLEGEPMHHNYEAVIAQVLSDAFIVPHMMYWEGHEGDQLDGETFLP